MSVRLNKLLAERGLGARRKCDALIASGAVRVNGQTVTEPGTQVEPDRDRIEVEGRPLPRAVERRTFVLNKPVGVISTLSDPEGRRSLRDYMPSGLRLFSVGRLDADTSGLLLLTNDGELAHHLMHPRYGVPKRYRVHVDQAPSEGALRRLREGIEFEPGVVSAPAEVWVRDPDGGEAVIELALHEGRHRQVRRMCEAAGLEVRRLHRWGYGPLRLGHLERGMWRELSEQEIADLRAASARARPKGARTSGATGQRSFERPPRRPRRETPPAAAAPTARPPRERPAGPAREERAAKPARPARPFRSERPEGRARPREERRGPRREFGDRRGGFAPRPERPASRPEPGGRRPRFERRERPGAGRAFGAPERPARRWEGSKRGPARGSAHDRARPDRDWNQPVRDDGRPARDRGRGKPGRGGGRSAGGFAGRPARGFKERPQRRSTVRPEGGFTERPQRRSTVRPERGITSRPERGFAARPERGFGGRPERGGARSTGGGARAGGRPARGEVRGRGKPERGAFRPARERGGAAPGRFRREGAPARRGTSGRRPGRGSGGPRTRS